VVVVEVGEENGVQAFAYLGGGSRNAPAQVNRAAPQERVGEQPDATALDEHGGVTGKGDSNALLRQAHPGC
jgi:hypothetical protein